MASETLTPDGNDRGVAGAVTDDSNLFIKRLRIDDTTKGLKVLFVGGVGGGTVNTVTDGTTTVTNPTTIDFVGGVVTNSSGVAVVTISASSPTLTVGTTPIASGTNTYIEYNNAGVLGEYSISGTGTVVAMAAGPTLTNPFVGTQTSSDNSTKAASTAYVTTAISNALAGVQPQQAVQYATTTAGNTSGLTYNNGASGIGATFTGANNTAITIDGHTFVVGDVGITRLLVKNDTQSPSGAFNGVYLFTALQTVGTGAVFTRALNYNQPSEMNNSGLIPVENGTANAGTTWVQTATIVTVGTTPLVFAQFSYSPTSIIAPTLGGTGVANNAASTITISGNFGTTFTVSGTTSVTLPTSGTLVNSAVATLSSLTSVGTITTGGLGTGATLGSVTVNIASSAVGDIHYLGASNVLTRLADVAIGSVLVSGGVTTAPAYSSTPTVSNILTTANAITASGNAATVPVTSRHNIVTNNSAATLTITLTTASAINMQMVVVQILDFSAVAQTITWVNTENSTVTAPVTSNGSTTLPLTVGFIYNSATSKWRTIAVA